MGRWWGRGLGEGGTQDFFNETFINLVLNGMGDRRGSY